MANSIENLVIKWQHGNTFALIQNEQIVSVHDTYWDALSAARILVVSSEIQSLRDLVYSTAIDLRKFKITCTLGIAVLS